MTTKSTPSGFGVYRTDISVQQAVNAFRTTNSTNALAHLVGNSGDRCVIPEIALHFARLCLAALHIAKLSPSPSGEGLGWGI